MTGEKIMIVDDNIEFLDELHEMLDLSGYTPLIINNSAAVLNAVAKHKPDIILLDLKMSGMSGFDVAQKIKQNPETSRIPIIAMSGYFPLEKNSLLLDTSYMSACLKKPFAISDLITHIETILNDRKAHIEELVASS